MGTGIRFQQFRKTQSTDSRHVYVVSSRSLCSVLVCYQTVEVARQAAESLVDLSV